MLKPRIGLLPFYIALYDEAMPELRTRLEPFILTIADALTELGIEVISTRTCCIRGWFKPQLPLEQYLADYSRLGGTHHSVVVYDADIRLIQLFGEAMGWQIELLAQA